MKISSVVAELFYANGPADSLMKLIFSFHDLYNFCTYFNTHHVFCPMQNYVTVIIYQSGIFLLLGTTRIFKEKGLGFDVNRLNYFCKFTKYHTTNKCTNCMYALIASLHEKQRTKIQDMLPQQYYNEKVHIFNT